MYDTAHTNSQCCDRQLLTLGHRVRGKIGLDRTKVCRIMKDMHVVSR